MNSASTAKPRPATISEAAGYRTGILLSMLRWFMPLRLWLTAAASVALLIFAFRTEDTLLIARAACAYLVLISLITVASVRRKP